MYSFLITAIIMFVFWFLLSGHTDPILLTLGVVSSLLVSYWSNDFLIGKGKKLDLAKGFRLLIYLPWLFWQIVLANILVVKLVLSPKLSLEPEILTIEHGLKTEFGIVLLANSITLTPGTITIDATGRELTVHAVDKSFADDLLAGAIQARVKTVEGEVKEMTQHAL